MTAKPGVKSDVTSPDVNQVREMLDRALSQREIARAMGISQPTVSRIAARLREQREGLSGDAVLWRTIASDPESYLSGQDNLLAAFLCIQQAWIDVCDGDIDILAVQKQKVIAAYRAEIARRAVSH